MRVRLACVVVFFLALGSPVAVANPSDHPPSELIGLWQGSSVCTDRVAAPACKDETIVYEFTAGSKAGVVRWKADKVVNGAREPMGELDVVFNASEGCWRAEFESPRMRSVWCIKVKGTKLEGTARLLPGNQVIRKVDAQKK